MIFLLVPSSLFIISLVSVCIQAQNILTLFLYLELSLLLIFINLSLSSYIITHSVFGEVYIFFLFIILAVESAICITVCVQFFRISNTINLKAINIIR
uniref:NADH dehydrogenase subunit 4L n=1 Tax=Abylopsis tetragona TaxID=316209 RepID=UPI0026E38C88|nr:NADH dehydrogenase subunit 4L [Abylopsis tetragona]WJJ69891.1 NADH dehydrogenase subunit 4L [Abylopsis tetragona]